MADAKKPVPSSDTHSPRVLVHVRPSPVHGMGVFALTDIAQGQVIDRCPCIILEDGWQYVQTVLHDYLYCWPREGDGRAIVLGHGSLFNHDANPNADWVTDTTPSQFVYHATRPIAAGTEIFINYGEDYWTIEHANANHHPRKTLAELLGNVK